jgi:hypothetical protein
VPLHFEKVKLRLEDEVLDAGATLLYGSLPVAVDLPEGDDRLRRVVIGNKSGRQIVMCRTEEVESASSRRIVASQRGVWSVRQARASTPSATRASRLAAYESTGRLSATRAHHVATSASRA